MKLRLASPALGLLLAFALPACSSDGAESKDTETPGTPAPFTPATPDDCLTEATPGEKALECDGLKFVITVPDKCLTSACGFIMDVHGFAMDANIMDLHTKFRSIATAAGYIVLQPSAPGAFLQAAWSEPNDEQVFALMNRVRNVWHPDEKRIHFGGYSQGGWMTWRFVCKHADILASAAPIAAGAAGGGGTSCDFAGDKMPARQLPIFYTHGTTDGLVSYTGATAMMAAVTSAWGLTQKEVVGSGPDYEWTRFETSGGEVFEFAHHDWETPFALGSIALKGHCFPGSDAVVGCGLDTAFVWGEEVLKFYIAHPKP
jgi:poly(3-hydroxybutyrate) depolymerase